MQEIMRGRELTDFMRNLIKEKSDNGKFPGIDVVIDSTLFEKKFAIRVVLQKKEVILKPSSFDPYGMNRTCAGVVYENKYVIGIYGTIIDVTEEKFEEMRGFAGIINQTDLNNTYNSLKREADSAPQDVYGGD